MSHRIIKLEAKNVMRLSAVSITPDGSVVRITGKNGAGKSSVLRSVAMALGGKDEIPPEPVRKGKRSGHVILDLGDLVIKRKWSKGGKNTYLEVRGKDGTTMTSPQKILDRLKSKLTFDPLAFMRMKPQDQADILRRVAGIDTEALDNKRDKAYADRRDVNRDLDRERKAFGALETPDDDLPETEHDLTALDEALDREAERNEEISSARTAISAEKAAAIGAVKASADLLVQLTALKTRIAEQENVITQHDEDIAAKEKALEELGEPADLTEMRATAAGKRDENGKIRAGAAWRTRSDEVTRLREHSDKLSDLISAVDDEKEEAILSAKFPVEGLGLDDDGASWNGLPLAQASSSEQLRVSVAMGFELNPDFPVMMIYDGSLLDSESFELLAKLAEERDGQIWIETVSDGDGPGIIIEDGHIAGEEVEEEEESEDDAPTTTNSNNEDSPDADWKDEEPDAE